MRTPLQRPGPLAIMTRRLPGGPPGRRRSTLRRRRDWVQSIGRLTSARRTGPFAGGVARPAAGTAALPDTGAGTQHLGVNWSNFDTGPAG